jgi:hypothetical protein
VSEALDKRAETLKLARLLSVDEGELAGLRPLTSIELRELREQATERLFGVGAPLLHRIGAAAKMLPSGLVATIAERAFGPLLCARAAGSVDPGKAIDVARRLPAEFLADTAVELDPRRVAPIIAGVPADLVVGVAGILGARGEHVTMGRFLAYVPDHAIAAAIGALSDEAMLRTAFVLEHKDRLDHAVSLLPAARLPGIIATASRLQLWGEALDLLEQLSDERRAPIAEIFTEQGPEVIAGLVAAVSETGIWDALLPIVRLMSPDGLKRLAAVPAFYDKQVLEQIIDAAAVPGAALWADLAPLVAELPEPIRAHVGKIAARLDRERLTAILADAAAHPRALPPLVLLVEALDDGDRAAIVVTAGEVARAAPEAVAAIIEATARERLWGELAPLLDLFPVIELLRELPADEREFIADAVAASADAIPPELMPLFAELQREGLLK